MQSVLRFTAMWSRCACGERGIKKGVRRPRASVSVCVVHRCARTVAVRRVDVDSCL